MVAVTVTVTVAEPGPVGMTIDKLDDGTHIILGVKAGGQAERIGVNPGDILVQLNQKIITAGAVWGAV
jgi:S1-C subfamily serine protease